MRRFLTRCNGGYGWRAIACAVLVAMLFSTGLYAAERTSDSAPAPAETPAEHLKFFEAKVRPILVETCHECHSGERPKADLHLDSREGALLGGESGEPAVVPGKPEESLLVSAIHHEGYEMPPSGKLKDEQIATLVEWVRIGAPWPSTPGEKAPIARREKITDEDRAYWAFQPVKRVEPPVDPADNWSRGAIDRFLWARMKAEGLSPSPPAGRAALIRRVTFDLIGLPPTAEEVEAFVQDDSPDAYEKLIDRLLASPHYGERWARHWLDLVRYAESDGYKQDTYRPDAWRYRDYVIRSFNADKPYDQFVREQIAGDEIAPHDHDAIVATGYYRAGQYEYNQRDVIEQYNVIRNDITDVTADVFLGLGLSCARCHDHKFDPLLQKDYYRLKAFFVPLVEHNATLATAEELAEYQQKLKQWEEATADLRRQIDEIERPLIEAGQQDFIKRFPDEIEKLFAIEPSQRTPYEQQLVLLASRQVYEEGGVIDFKRKLKGETLERWKELKSQLAEFDHLKPEPLPKALAATDVGPVPPPTVMESRRASEEVEPGIITVLDEAPLTIDRSVVSGATSGRRTALANWMTSPDNPLTPRVIVNRVWQYHFGRGLVESSSDFGRLGQPPSHPELLDYLASEFVAQGWSIKALHRQILLSAAYRQTSTGPEALAASKVDPANRWLARMTVRRLGAEQIRDSVLLASGELDLTAGGPSVEPDAFRRSIYSKVIRNKREPLLDAFDVPDGTASVPERNVTTTPIQSLLMINGPWMLERAAKMAERIGREVVSGQSDEDLNGPRITRAYRIALSRSPTADELAMAREYLGGDDANERLVDFCHVLLNSNEFLYVD